MSTHAYIGLENDRKVKAIYCHFDGYLEGVGKTLYNHYKDIKKVNKLLSLGDLSILGEQPTSDPRLWHDLELLQTSKECRAYNDRGEDTVAQTYNSIDELVKENRDNAYCFYVYSAADHSWKYIDADEPEKKHDLSEYKNLFRHLGKHIDNEEDEMPEEDDFDVEISEFDNADEEELPAEEEVTIEEYDEDDDLEEAVAGNDDNDIQYHGYTISIGDFECVVTDKYGKEFGRFATEDEAIEAIDEQDSLEEAVSTSVTIPAGTKVIKDSQFYGRNDLTSIVLPNGVTTIGDMAFYGCDNLISVIIPNSVTTIGYAAFGWCDSLKSITIPNSVTTIEEDAFNRCENLKSIQYTGTKAEWEQIEKSDDWKSDSPACIIHCKDGDINELDQGFFRPIRDAELEGEEEFDESYWLN